LFLTLSLVTKSIVAT